MNLENDQFLIQFLVPFRATVWQFHLNFSTINLVDKSDFIYTYLYVVKWLWKMVMVWTKKSSFKVKLFTKRLPSLGFVCIKSPWEPLRWFFSINFALKCDTVNKPYILGSFSQHLLILVLDKKNDFWKVDLEWLKRLVFSRQKRQITNVILF